MIQARLHRVTPLLSAVFIAGLFVTLLLSTSACALQESDGEAPLAPTEEGLKIVASIFAPYDFAQTIVGEVASVSLLVPPGSEAHSFEPSPADVKLLNSADIFIYAGGESDAWLDKIISSLDNPDLTLVRLVELVDVLQEEALEGISTEAVDAAGTADAHASDAAEIDEHVWTSLRNAQIIVSALAATFSNLDPEHAELFGSNAQTYNAQLELLDAQMVEIVKNAQRTTLVFGDRFPFRYFVEDYELSYYAAFPGCSSAVDFNPKTIIFLIDTVRQQKVPVVLYLELSDGRIAHTIAEETGAQALQFYSAHNISKEDFNAGVTYLSLMQANAATLKVALN